MYINRQENRSGSLFLKNFKRVMIDDEHYLKYIIFYIHYNPVKHDIVNNMSSYKYSSYNRFNYKINSNIKIDEVLNGIFNNINDSLINVLSYENNTWYSYSPLKLNNNLQIMKPSYGYFVNVNESTSLIIS